MLPTEFNKKQRLIIYERDRHSCVMPSCNDKFGLSVAHIFVSRAKGGMGVKENGALLCYLHHSDLDQANRLNHIKVKEYTENYLTYHYGLIEKQSLIYSRWKGFQYE